MNNISFYHFFPNIVNLDISKIPQDSVYVGVAGFEDRCFTFLEKCYQDNIKIQNVVGIIYEPFDEKNNVKKFQELSEKVAVETDIELVTYDRHNPEAFSDDFTSIYEKCSTTKNIIVDISGMSKFLIVILLYKLKNYEGNVHIVYCEAGIYHPLREEYESKKKIYVEDTIPSFLTTNVYNIVTTTELSSTSMQNYPLFLIAFPTFNYKDMFTLLNEITPQYLFKIEGKPKEEQDHWRLEALKWINRELDNDFDPSIKGISRKELSTFNYVETIESLNAIYEKYKYTHKCIITPTGSKLQTLGVLFFKQMYPEIQLVYPVTSHFLDEYTEGCKELWHIKFNCFAEFMREVSSFRKSKLHELESMLQE